MEKLIVHCYVSLAGVYICVPLHGGEFERTQLLCALATFLPRSCGNETNRDNLSTVGYLQILGRCVGGLLDTLVDKSFGENPKEKQTSC